MKPFYVFILLFLVGWFGTDSLNGQDDESVRFATFNTSLYRNESGGLVADLRGGRNGQAKKVAAILQSVRPDVVLLNEFDFDKDGQAIQLFLNQYLGKPQYGNQPIAYPFTFLAPVNTGVDSGMDLDNDGKKSGTMNDAFGFGRHPGQYGMVVLSKFPIENVRTFQKFLWKDMPELEWPIDPTTKEPYYSEEVKSRFRLSSKSHWDVPVVISEKQTIHFLVSHPTPPVFDRDEDRNGCRNHDEIRFWADYVQPGKSDYIYDDSESFGGLPEGAHFVIAGDLNADPNDGDSRNQAARLLTKHPLINNDFVPASQGGVEAAEKSGKMNLKHSGNPAHDTGDFNDKSVGNLRIDYVLPSQTLAIEGSGVFWPSSGEQESELASASDHRLVWIDIRK